MIGCDRNSDGIEQVLEARGFERIDEWPTPPESPPEVYLVDRERSPLVRAEILTGDWTGMGGERFEDVPEGRRWPEPQSRGSGRVISFRHPVPPDFLIVEVYHKFDEEEWEVVPVPQMIEGGEVPGPNLTFECVRNMPCFESDGEYSYWHQLPNFAAPREVINVYASWTVFPFNLEEPTVGANWRFHFLNDDADLCHWFRDLLRIC